VIRLVESRSISEGVTYGQRKSFSDGKVNLPYGLGIKMVTMGFLPLWNKKLNMFG